MQLPLTSPAPGATRHRAAVAGTAVFAAAAVAGAVICPFSAATGLDCPFCGGTRAVFAAARGDVAVAFSHNALVMGAAALIPAAILAAVALARHEPLRAQVRQVRWAPALLSVLAVFTVIRNLPFAWAEPLRA